jgi:hypothetical protein
MKIPDFGKNYEASVPVVVPENAVRLARALLAEASQAEDPRPFLAAARVLLEGADTRERPQAPAAPLEEPRGDRKLA